MHKNTDYLAAAKIARKLIIDLFQNRLDQWEKTRYWLAKKSGIPEGTLSRYWNYESDMPLINLLRICGALEIRPYFILKELDENHIQNMDLN